MYIRPPIPPLSSVASGDARSLFQTTAEVAVYLPDVFGPERVPPEQASPHLVPTLSAPREGPLLVAWDERPSVMDVMGRGRSAPG